MARRRPRGSPALSALVYVCGAFVLVVSAAAEAPTNDALRKYSASLSLCRSRQSAPTAAARWPPAVASMIDASDELASLCVTVLTPKGGRKSLRGSEPQPTDDVAADARTSGTPLPNDELCTFLPQVDAHWVHSQLPSRRA